MARAAAALVSQRSQSEMCTDYNMPISCCTSCMRDSNTLRLQIICRFVPAQLLQMPASAACPCCRRYRRGEHPPPGPRQYRRNSGPAATVRSPGAGRKCPSGLASDVVSALQAAVARMLRRFGVSIGVLEAWMQDKVSHFDAKPRRRAAIQLQHRELRVRRSDDVLGQRGSARSNVVDLSEAIHEQEIQGYVGILHPHGYPLALGK